MCLGERHSIVSSRQINTGFEVDVGGDPGSPSRTDPPCLSGLLRMTLSWVGSPVLAPGTPPPAPTKKKTLSNLFYQVAIILTLTTQPSDSIPRNLPERNENICPPKDLYRNAYCIFIANSPKPETTQMSINW